MSASEISLSEGTIELQKGETYDIKRIYVALRKHDISLGKYDFDTMLAAYLLDYNLKDDIAYLAREFNYLVSFNENIYNKKI